jgi:glycosyltransferase involved in cell wall biosynthesis
MPLRVLVVARWYPAHDDPGRGIFVADQVAALSAAGVEVTVASWEVAILGDPAEGRSVRGEVASRLWSQAIRERPEVAAPRSWAARGIPVTRLPAIIPTGEGASRHPVDLAAYQAETLVAFGTELAARWPFDLIHAHTGMPDGIAAARLAERLGLPLVVTEHDSGIAGRLGDERARAAYRALFGPGRRVLAVSEALARRVGDLVGLPDGSVGVIPNVVDVAAFRPVGAGERNPDELLWVGSRQARKGTDVLLEAFGRLRTTRPALRLRLIGRPFSAAEEARLKALARDLQISEAVAFEPAADRATVADAMARAALFVHPSPLETFGVVAVEALASGLPIAATPSGGVDEIVGRDGRFGEVATAIDAPALADAIVRALDRRSSFDPVLLRTHAEEKYAAPVVAARILDVYRTLVPASAPGVRLRAGRPEPPTGGDVAEPVPTLPPLLVLGLRRRPALARISLLPQELAASLQVLTSAARGAAQTEPDLPGGTTWTFVEADAAFFDARRRLGGPLEPRSMPVRLLRAARHPLRDIRLRHLARRRAGLALDARREALRSAIAGLRSDAAGSADRPVDVLALDADDVAVLAPLIGAGIRLHAGTLRSLADRWDASGRPALRDPGLPDARDPPTSAVDVGFGTGP